MYEQSISVLIIIKFDGKTIMDAMVIADRFCKCFTNTGYSKSYTHRESGHFSLIFC